MPPECSCCVHEPAGAAPRPAIKTPHERAPQLDEVERSLREVWEAREVAHSIETVQHTRLPQARQASLPRQRFSHHRDRRTRSTLPFGPPDVMAGVHNCRLQPVVERSDARNHACPPRFEPSSAAASKCARRQSRRRSRTDQSHFASQCRHSFGSSFECLPPGPGGNRYPIRRSGTRPSSSLRHCTLRPRNTRC